MKIKKITCKDLDISIADSSQISVVLQLLKEAALWLKNRNIDYWQNWINPNEIFIDWIKQGFDNKEFFMVRYNDEIIGTFRLQWSDELFWKNRNDESGYIHSFTTLRKYEGNNIGTNEFYINHNFENVGILDFNHNNYKEKLNLYEKKL